MIRLLRRGRFDLIYGNNTSSSSGNAMLAAKVLGRPFICHVRGMGRRRSWRKLAFLRFADATIAVSDACARANQEYVGRKESYVVYNGIDLGHACMRTSGAREHLLAQCGLPQDALILVGVGRISPRKGQQDLIQALSQILQGEPSAHLLLVGPMEQDSEYVRSTRRLVCTLGLRNRVSFLGFRPDVPEVLAGSDLLLHAAHADPHPRVVLEAMAARLPVVSYAVDGVAETVVDGETGRLVPLGAVDELARTVLELACDGRRRADLGRRGQEVVRERFSAEDTAAQVGDIMDAVLASR